MKNSQQNITMLVRELDTSLEQGLTHQKVSQLLSQYGYNELPSPTEPSLIATFLGQFKNPLIYILLIAAVLVYLVAHDLVDALVISVVLICNAILGTIQEVKTRKLVNSLRQFTNTTALVLREGKTEVIQETELVPGDIMILQAGQRVAADGRIIESHTLTIDEAVLTGESVPAYKQAAYKNESTTLPNNMVFKGTYVFAGTARVLVTATGLKTQLGSIAQRTQENTPSPLEQELYRLSYVILLVITVICSGVFLIGLASTISTRELIIMITALFVGVVPEGLPLVLTLVLVRGVVQLAREKVLVRNIQSVEGLGRVQIIAVDKTGTLTRNEMMVTQVATAKGVYHVTGTGYSSQGELFFNDHKIDSAQHPDVVRMAITIAQLNNTYIVYLPEQGLYDIKGDPTEAAMWVFAQKVTESTLDKVQDPILEIPFDSKHRYHALFYQHKGRITALVSGSPELLLARAHNSTPHFKQVLQDFFDQGLRVVGIATKEIDGSAMPKPALEHKQWFHEQLLSGLEVIGFCGMNDAIRTEVKPVIEQTRAAGIQVIMITGDHQKTAQVVAQAVGIFKPGDEVLDGEQLRAKSDEQLQVLFDRVTVVSRCLPDDKVRIVKLLQRQGKLVAMTGDGVNDAPSLMAADVGIAMGRIGTQVAKQAADLVLLEDSFSYLIGAIAYARYLFATLRRVIWYFFSTNLAEVLIVLFSLAISVITGSPAILPLTAAQLLWLNLVTDGFLDAALTVEPYEQTRLAPQTGSRARLVTMGLMAKVLYAAIVMAVGSLSLFWYYMPFGPGYARSVALLTMAMFQWFNAWNCRSETKSLTQLGLGTNRWLIAATLLVFILQVAQFNVPWMQHVFKAEPLPMSTWLVCAGMASSIIFFEEMRKAVVRRWWLID